MAVEILALLLGSGEGMCCSLLGGTVSAVRRACYHEDVFETTMQHTQNAPDAGWQKMDAFNPEDYRDE